MSTFIIHNPKTPVDRQAFLERCEQGLKERYGDPAPQEARDRLDYELAVIEQHGLTGTFYAASEFAAAARRHAARVAPCPDSARNSLTAHVLGINGIDPLEHGLLFERFLSPEADAEPSLTVQLESGRRHYSAMESHKARFGDDVGEFPDPIGAQGCFDKMLALCDLIGKHSPENIPVDDEESFALLRSDNGGDPTSVLHALYTGLFPRDWCEKDSEQSSDLLAQLSPKRLSDVMAFIAVNRPGPLESGLTDEYAKAVSGNAPLPCRDERLRLILEETRGFMLYQEQVMLASMVVGGFSAGKADTLRKALGKKKRDAVSALQEDWSRGAAENGCSPMIAELIWDDMDRSMVHAYDKSWAATLATLLMRFAYLEVHCPEEWAKSDLS